MSFYWHFLMVLSCLVSRPAISGSEQTDQQLWTDRPLKYTVDLTLNNRDLFKVTLDVDDLTPKNRIYQFAATAPGTYQVMDIGRFVKNLKAYDSMGQVIQVHRLSTNQWLINQPEQVARIEYFITETWDTPVDRDEIYPMAGTSLEDDHALLNGQAIFGFPQGMQGRPLQIQLVKPDRWQMGTALEQQEDGSLLAQDFDHVVDSPILLGNLSFASRKVRNCEVQLFAYSKNGRARAGEILTRLDDIIEATDEFLDGFPVDRYTFLYHFEDFHAGAWEHSYSSLYVVSEHDYVSALDGFIPRTAAHEIFHMVTPLHIHSNNIHPFNFARPKPSAHIWLYEGVTEWASGMMQLRANLMDLETYLAKLSTKLSNADKMDRHFSLEQLSLQSYTSKGQREWSNIYNRGAIVAALLDIQLLHQSNGTRGLREVVQQLAETYGPDRSFDEQGFWEAFVAFTDPEVMQFLDAYVRDTRPLPLEQYFAFLGIDYIDAVQTGRRVPDVGFSIHVTSGRDVLVHRLQPHAIKMGLRPGDRLIRLDGIAINGKTLTNIKQRMAKKRMGEVMTIDLERQGQPLSLRIHVPAIDEVQHHIFRVRSDPTVQQLALRNAWLQNLPR